MLPVVTPCAAAGAAAAHTSATAAMSLRYPMARIIRKKPGPADAEPGSSRPSDEGLKADARAELRLPARTQVAAIERALEGRRRDGVEVVGHLPVRDRAVADERAARRERRPVLPAPVLVEQVQQVGDVGGELDLGLAAGRHVDRVPEVDLVGPRGARAVALRDLAAVVLGRRILAEK